MTPQQIFDKVATHLLKQGRRAMNGDACAYRGGDGTSCAVGCLIPDDQYDSYIEGRLVNHSKVRDSLPFEVDADIERLLLALQHAHDFRLKVGIGEFLTAMHSIAEEFGLSPAVLDQPVGG